MRTLCSIAAFFVLLGSLSHQAPATADPVADQIIALERRALERWGKGDPQGYLDLMSKDETYFDPGVPKRIDGLEALRQYFAPFTGKISIERFELIDPKVQHHGDVAVLTFNIVDYGAQLDGGPKKTVRWNVTEVYQKLDARWKIIHSHFSLIKPDLK